MDVFFFAIFHRRFSSFFFTFFFGSGRCCRTIGYAIGREGFSERLPNSERRNQSEKDDKEKGEEMKRPLNETMKTNQGGGAFVTSRVRG